MRNTSLLLYVTHGTYGRDDDAFGAMLAANSALAKGLEAGMILVEDGVAMAKTGQNPGPIGVPSNLDELQDFIDLGGELFVCKEAMEERGIGKEELIEDSQVKTMDEISGLLFEYPIYLTF